METNYKYAINSKKRHLYSEDIPQEIIQKFGSYIPPNEKIKYKSYFFRSDLLDIFTKDVKNIYIQNNKECILNNYKLYNIDNIIILLLDNIGIKTRNYNSEKINLIKQQIIKLIPERLGEMGSKTVDEGYVNDQFNENIGVTILNENIIKPYVDDIIIIADTQIENLNIIEPNNKNKIQRLDSQLDSDYEMPINSDEDSDLEPELGIVNKTNKNLVEKTILEESFNSSDSDSEYEDADSNFLLNITNNIKFQEKIKMIVGYMIVSRGKCKMFPNDYILNLISTSIPGVGSLLLGLYLYTIVKHPILPITIEDVLEEDTYNLSGNATIKYTKNKNEYNRTKYEDEYGISIYKKKFITKDDLIPTCGLGILELSYGYFNYPGLCSYQKFGFNYDKSLFSKNEDTYCAEVFDPLPMSVYLGDDVNDGCYNGLTKNQKIQKILDIIIGIDKCSQNKICTIKNKIHQQLLSCLNSLISYQDSQVVFKNIDDYEIINDENMEDENMNEECINVLNMIDLIKPENEINYNFIKKIINDITNDNITDDVISLEGYFKGGSKKKNTKKNKKSVKNKNKNKKSVKKINKNKLKSKKNIKNKVKSKKNKK